MMRKKKTWNHSFYNLHIYIIMLAALLLVGALSYVSLRTQLLKNMQNLGTTVAKSYAAESNSNLVVYESMIFLTAESVDMRHEESKEDMKDWFRRYFERAQAFLGEDTIVPYMVFEGTVITVEPWNGIAACDYLQQDWYNMALEADGDVIFTDIYECSVYKRPVITVTKKCADADAVVAFDIYPENFQFLYTPLEMTEEASFYVCDRNGRVLYSQMLHSGHTKEQLQSHINGVIDEIKNGEHDKFDSKSIDLDGCERNVYYVRYAKRLACDLYGSLFFDPV